MAAQDSRGGILLWRFIAGVGIGVELVTIDTYISELVPKSIRGRVFAINQAIQFVAVPLATFLSWQLVPIDPLGIAGWRWVVAVPVLGALFVWWIRREVPESPRWLAQHGRSDEADRVTAKIEARVAAETKAALPAAQPGVVESGGAGYSEIWKPPYRRRTIMLSVFNFFQVIGFYGFGSWVQQLLTAQGTSVVKGLEYGVAIALVFPLGPLLCSLFADRLERKWQICCAAFGTAVFGLLFSTQSGAFSLILLGILITTSNNLLSYALSRLPGRAVPDARAGQGSGICLLLQSHLHGLQQLYDRLLPAAFRLDRRLFLHRLRNGHGDPGDRRLRTAHQQSGARGDFAGGLAALALWGSDQAVLPLLEYLAAYQAGHHIRGEEQVVDLEEPAERQQHHQPPDVS